MDPNNRNNNSKKIIAIQRDVEIVKDTMIDNLDKITANLGNASDLEQRTRDLEENSFIFRKKSKQVRCQMLWENWKITLVITGIVLIVLTIIIVAFTNH